MPTVNDVVVHCQKQIKKEPPAEKLMHYLSRLDRLQVTVQDLMDTGVGRTINQLSRHDGKVGKFASKLVKKWKAMVSDENSEDSEDSQSSSSSQESEDAGEDSGHEQKVDLFPPLKQEAGRNVNGYRKYEHDELEDEFVHENKGPDSDDDRLCIADEVSNSSKGNKPRNVDEPLIKQETSLPCSSGEDTDVCDEMEEDKNLVHCIPEETYSPKKIKTETLSESDNSASESDYQTQIVPHKHIMEIESNLDRNKTNTLLGTRKVMIRNQPDDYNHRAKESECDDSKKSYSENDRSSDNKSSRHHRSEKEKQKKDRHHSSEKKHKRSKEIYNPSTVKLEPIQSEHSGNEDHSPFKHKEKKSKRDQEKGDKNLNEYRKNKDHKDKKERHSHSHKSKRKHKDKSKRDSRHNGESSKRKNEESAEKRTSSGSPDRKKIKLERHEESSTMKHSITKKPSIHIEEEINSTSGVKFEELLGCLDKNLNKSKDKSRKHVSSTSGSKDSEEVTKLVRRDDLKKKPQDKRKKHIESVIAPTLNISPNYKPPTTSTILLRPMVHAHSKLANLNNLQICDPGQYWEDSRIVNNYNKDCNSDDALSSMITSRKERTKVFSGRAIGCTGIVPKLFDLCMQVIQENIGDLGYTGGVPYEILKPAVDRATAPQLLQIEEYNPYLIGSTDELWKFHCSREFRGRERQEMETWRELYERCIFERNEKFAIVRKKMLKKGEVAVPVRKAKLAYVEPVGGPRFSRQKAATIKNGMKTLKIKEEKGPKKGVGSSASVGFNNPTEHSKIVEEQAVLINPESRTGGHHGPGSSASRGESTARVKPKKAPMMAKTLKFIKTLQRR